MSLWTTYNRAKRADNAGRASQIFVHLSLFRSGIREQRGSFERWPDSSKPPVYTFDSIPRSVTLSRPPGSHVHAARNVDILPRAERERNGEMLAAPRFARDWPRARVVIGSRAPAKSVRLDCRLTLSLSLSLSLQPLAAAFCLSLTRCTRPLFALPPPPPPPIAFPSLFFLSHFPISSILSFCQPAVSRSLGRRLFLALSVTPMMQLLSLSRTPVLSLRRAHSRLPFDAEQARNERNRNLSSAVASSVSSCAAGCSLLLLLPLLLLLLSLLLSLFFALSLLFVHVFFPSSFLTFSPSFLSVFVRRAAAKEAWRLSTKLHRPRSTRRHCPKLVGEMARHSFRHRNQLARLLFHTATHPLCDHRSHPTYPPLFLRSRRISDEGMSPWCAFTRPFGGSGSESWQLLDRSARSCPLFQWLPTLLRFCAASFNCFAHRNLSCRVF